MRFVLPLILCVVLLGCGEKITTLEDLHTSDLKLPGGKIIKIEMMVTTFDLMRGLAFRPSIAQDEGMLFIHKAPGNYSYWMYQHVFPLDMILIGEDRRIVEIVENVPPCKTVASKCESYGGKKLAKYALQMGAGMAKKYRLKVGDFISW